MILFYATIIEGNLAILQDEEAHHCVQVLRKRMGDRITCMDGVGWFYETEIIAIEKKTCTLQILNQWKDPNQSNFQIHIAIAPTKNIERLEWFLEKATELGVDRVTPLLCEHSERKQIRQDRLEKILLSAAKQSLKATLPKLDALTSFSDCIHSQEESKQKFIAYIGDESNQHLKNAYQPGTSAIILIGPEGDFSSKEIQIALQNSFVGVSLGKSRLRTETAGIAACHIIKILNES